MSKGNVYCVSCKGKGGWRDGFGWHKCHCTRPTKDQRAAIKRLHSIGAADPQGRLFDPDRKQT